MFDAGVLAALLAVACAASPLDVPPELRAAKPIAAVGPKGLGACADCHSAKHDEWAGSRHAAAATNALFAISFSRTHQAWCLNCHAPLSAQRFGEGPRLVMTDAARDGVGCPACHLREGQVIAFQPPSAEAQAAHPMLTVDSPNGLCASCHDFNVPWRNLPEPIHRAGYSAVPMQDTFDEWRQSAAAKKGVGCVSCHGAHAVRGARDVAWLAQVLKVEAKAGKGRVDARIVATGVAHAWPTGDPFRVARFEVCGDAACAQILGTQRIHHAIKDPVVVPPAVNGDAAQLAFTLPVSAKPVAWRLVYSLAEPEVAARLPPAEREVELAHGTF